MARNAAARAKAPRPPSAGRRPPPSAMRLERTIHEGVRLAIVSALAAASPLSFGELKGITGATDGNLSVHARRLEEAGYVSCTKTFAGRVPRSEYRLTADGRRALERYIAHLESILARVRR